MKLALVTPGGVDESGTTRVIPAFLWLIERLARNHDVHVFAIAQEPRPRDWTLLGARVHNVGTVGAHRLRFQRAFGREHRVAPFGELGEELAHPEAPAAALPPDTLVSALRRLIPPLVFPRPAARAGAGP